MHSDDTPIIQFRRTQLVADSEKVKTEPLTFGEALVCANEHRMILCDTADGGVASEQKATKLVDQDIVDYSVYYDYVDMSNTVYPKADTKEALYWDTKYIKRGSLDVALEDDLVDLHERLTAAENALELKANLASPSFTGNVLAPNPLTKNSEQVATTGWVSSQVLNNREEKKALSTGNIYITGLKVNPSSTAEKNQTYYCQNAGLYINTATARLYGAAWNDFAEFEPMEASYEPGTVVADTGRGTMKKTARDMQGGAAVISDTYGMAIGEQTNNTQPIAVAGKVLAKYSGDTSVYLIGSAVCATDIGLIRPMSRKEIQEFPDRIIGTVCEIPTAKWNDIDTAGRLWIRLK